MKAVHFSKPGGPEVLKVINIETPKIGSDEILIKVKASGINRPDVVQREGNYPPPESHSKNSWFRGIWYLSSKKLGEM